MKRSIVRLVGACVFPSSAQKLSFNWKASPINASVLISGTRILPSNPADLGLLLVLVIMFLAGLALAYIEVIKWWKARMAHYRPPPLAKLITYVPDSDRGWRATHVLWFSLPPLEKKATPEQLLPSVQSVQEDRPKKAA